jgi:hypothetical protein
MMPSVTVTNSIRMNSIRVGVRPGSGLYMVFAHREGTDVCVNKMVPSIILRHSSFVWFRPFFVNSRKSVPLPNHAFDALRRCATSR